MTQPKANDPPAPPQGRLREIAGLFAKLGFTAFGGPAAHVAMMEREVVSRRRWLDREHFLDVLASVNFIPGPNSTQLAMQLGYLRGGFAGLVVAGFCFIVPAVLIILPLAWLYVSYGTKPDIREALVGIGACVVAIVASALLRFAKTGIRDRFTLAVAIIAAALGFLCEPRVFDRLQRWAGGTQAGMSPLPTAAGKIGIVVAGPLRGGQPEIFILAAAAVVGALWYGRPNVKSVGRAMVPLLALPASTTATAPAVVAGWGPMVLFFLKVGATLFGSGYVLVSYLQSGLVDRYGWLTRQQLLDAVAVGQVTPGPLLTTATFIGFLLGHGRFGGGLGGGVLGAVLATAAIFLPSFVFVSLLGPLLPRIRQYPLARGALNAMNAAVVSLVLVVTIRLGAAALIDPFACAITASTVLAILRWDVNSTWLILASAAAGVVRYSIR